MIKAPCSLRCVYVPRDPDGPFVSHCLASTKGPSAHFGGAEESKPQSLKSHLTAISYGALPQQRPRPPTSSCKSKVPPPPPPPPPPPSPPLWIHAGTQTQQSVQEVRPWWQTAELSWRVQHMAAACGSASPLRKIRLKLDFIYFFGHSIFKPL